MNLEEKLHLLVNDLVTVPFFWFVVLVFMICGAAILFMNLRKLK